jgi:hypothetical protein
MLEFDRRCLNNVRLIVLEEECLLAIAWCNSAEIHVAG